MTDISTTELKTVRQKADELARIRALVTARSHANTPTNIEDRIKSDAAGLLLSEALEKAEREYRNAVRQLSPDQLLMIANDSA